MKTITITFSNNEIYHLDIKVVALSRTEYFAKEEGFKKRSQKWNKEYKEALKEVNAIDWLMNNMSWDNIKNKAKKQKIKTIDYTEELFNRTAKIDII